VMEFQAAENSENKKIGLIHAAVPAVAHRYVPSFIKSCTVVQLNIKFRAATDLWQGWRFYSGSFRSSSLNASSERIIKTG